MNWIQPGIENLDDELLQSMEKGVTALQNICILRNAVELGMRVTWTILYGFPGETNEQYHHLCEMAPLLEHVEPPNGCVPIRLDRFSPYYERAAEFGFRDVHPAMAYSAVYALPEETLARLAYYFEDRSREKPTFVTELDQAIKQWQREWFSRDGDPPVLFSTDFGPGKMIEDTRTCSVQRWRYLTPEETVALEAFREPRNIRTTLANLGPDAAATFNRLAAWCYILIDKDRALSLVAQKGPLTENRAAIADFPGGFLMPPKEAKEQVAG